MWYLFEFLVVIIVVTVVTTQVVWPSLAGTRLFPILRRRKLEAQLVTAREQLEQDRLAHEASELWSRAYGSETEATSNEKEPNSKDE